MAKARKVIFVSSSISNFREKLHKRMGLPFWNIFRLWQPCIFFGLYNRRDWALFLLHRGKKKVFWCGGDIKNLKHDKNRWWREKIADADVEHNYCENEAEQKVLMSMGIFPDICPMIFTDADSEIAFIPSRKPHIYMTAHPGREAEYGVGIIEEIAHLFPEYTFHIFGLQREITLPNIQYEVLKEKDFNEKTKNYHCAVRLNRFDGFGETVAKALLRGKYAITYIEYPHIAHASALDDFVHELKKVKHYKKPNMDGRSYWIKELEENRKELLA